METLSATDRVQGYLQVARAPFLALPVTLILLGSAAAVVAGGFDPVAAILAFVGLLSLHVSINARNEYRDYQSGVDHETDPTPFSGGSKTLPEGELEPVAAKRLATVTAGIGAVIGGYFIVEVGLLLVPITIVGAISVLFYTSHLTRYGLGELFAGLGLGGLPVLGTGLVQVGSITPEMLVASVPATLLTFNLLLLNEFPDVAADRRGDRQNLIHRLGRSAAGWIYVAAGLGVPLAIVAGWAGGVFPAWGLLGILPSLLLARPARWAITEPDTDLPVGAQRDNVLWILATNAVLALGLIVPSFV
ncbi:prenyltransferase [Halodesulfurarchaeum sp. HSR-GB]|uniref:prenyltransferase n=1 Tax=Halodesulfurarchaeum sp. HSR-GB TaxID=3074077 RepID=UPI0028624D9D|nr:prenyltransferase [Halodesulfurarchaeum sp. HSR-GB]MDR5656645.1 prenyltransferase [Halodesulfurarchaeum sp. HSR-GB]